MLSYTYPVLDEAENAAASESIASTWQILRKLTLADFLAMPDSLDRNRYPALATITPTMPPPETQARWTGHSGYPLLCKTSGTLRLLQIQSFALRGRDLGAGPILDYGCGWGRLMRGLGYFVHPDQIHGADPMEDSLVACRQHKVIGNIHKVGTTSQSDPLPVRDVDTAFSYSVMTHTSRESTRAILAAVRSVIADDGIYATTIRPVEFWTMRAQALGEDKVADLVASHQSHGYAFFPIGGGTELHEQDYGDVSFSLEVFGELAADTGWRVARLDRDTLEPWQLTIVLLPA